MSTRARVVETPSDWARNTVRLLVARDHAFLMSDGTWRAVEEGALIPDDAGIVLPRETIETISVAIEVWQGHTSHADTEVRVLREWLTVERDRVSRVLFPSDEPT